MIVADTDVLIDALRGREPASSRVADALRDGTLATTAVNCFRVPERSDYLIAGICLSRASSLLTRNRKHFERIAGLSLDSL